MRRQRKGNKYKSRWEETVAGQIEKLGYPVVYEEYRIQYEIPSSLHWYTPDFQLPSGWYVEAKGKFDRADRKKHLLIKEQYPKLKIIILFQNANQRIAKRSNTTYGQWCDKNGIKWAHQKLDTKKLK